MINSSKLISCNFKNIHLFTYYLNYDIDCLNCSLIKERIEKTGILKNVVMFYIFLLNKFKFLQKILKNNSLSKFIFGLIILLYESNIVETDLASIKSKKKFDQTEFKSSEIFDVIVVGSGPGGSLAANEVIKKYSKVLLIESGDNFKQNSVQHHSYLQTKLQFKNEGMTFCLGNIPMIYAEGSTLGGGSEVNSGLYFKLVNPYKTKLLKACNLNIEEWSIAEKEIEHSLSVQNDPNFDIFRITNYNAYCPLPSSSKGYKATIEYWSENSNLTFDNIYNELLEMGVLDFRHKLIYGELAPRGFLFPTKSVGNEALLNKMRDFIGGKKICNLLLFGQGSKKNTFYTTQILQSAFRDYNRLNFI